MKTLVVGLERFRPSNTADGTDDRSYWGAVDEALSLFEKLACRDVDGRPIFEFVPSTYDFGPKDVRFDWGTVGWRRPLHGVLLFVRPPRYFPLLNRYMEYDTLSVRRLDIPDTASEETKFGPPTALFVPAKDGHESYSRSIVGVRSSRYRFEYFAGNAGAILDALVWIAEKAEIPLISPAHS